MTAIVKYLVSTTKNTLEMAPKYFHIHIQFNIPKKAYTGKKKILLKNFYINNQDY